MDNLTVTTTVRMTKQQYLAFEELARQLNYRHGLRPNISAAIRAALDAGLEKLKEKTEEKNDGN